MDFGLVVSLSERGNGLPGIKGHPSHHFHSNEEPSLAEVVDIREPVCE
jgi:hypothetical protein